MPSPSRRGGVSSPLTDEAEEAFCEVAFEESLEVGVFFFVSVPASARLAWRAAFDAETIFVYVFGKGRGLKVGKESWGLGGALSIAAASPRRREVSGNLWEAKFKRIPTMNEVFFRLDRFARDQCLKENTRRITTGKRSLCDSHFSSLRIA